MDDWTLLVALSGSIIALTALVTITVRHRFKGSITIAAASILGIFAGVSGASHGPGEILQGDRAPNGIIIEALPELTSLGGEPHITLDYGAPCRWRSNTTGDCSRGGNYWGANQTKGFENLPSESIMLAQLKPAIWKDQAP